MLQTVLQKEMQTRGLSSHTAAEEIGVSHTTILRALRGETVDLDTVIKIANFLKVRPSELLNSMAESSLSDQIAVLLSHSRDLEAELRSAVEAVQSDKLDPAILRDIVSYALYKLQSSGVMNDSVRSRSSSDGASKTSRRKK